MRIKKRKTRIAVEYDGKLEYCGSYETAKVRFEQVRGERLRQNT